MINYLSNINTNTFILLTKKYCNIDFSIPEAEIVLPYLKSISKDYYNNPSMRTFYQNNMKEKFNNSLYIKIMNLLTKLNIK